MGVFFSKVWSSLFGPREVKLVIVGLDNAGKTTILYKLLLGKDHVISTAPTVGSNVETVVHRNVHFVAWDLGGQDTLRASWSVYYANAKAVLMVVDSSDRARIGIARDELFRLLSHPDLQQSVVLVFANKQDIRGGMTAVEVSEQLHLHKIRSHEWHIQSCCALTHEGLEDGLNWVVEKLKKA